MTDETIMTDETTMIFSMLESIYIRIKALEEKTDCVLHTICKNDDKQTHKAIAKFLISEFRNRN